MSQYKSAEAFCVMNYKCEECGKIEYIWNSRDGVTPFTTSSLCCTDKISSHVNWNEDYRAEFPGRSVTRVFIDCTKEDAVEFANKYWDKYGERLMEAYEHLAEMGKEEFICRKIESVYGNGTNPKIISVEEYWKRLNKEEN